jgi:hypothetical protein
MEAMLAKSIRQLSAADHDIENILAWTQEIDRRVAELDSDLGRTEPWDVVRKRLRRPSGD